MKFHYQYIILGFIFLLGLSSCENFEEFNENPNEPSTVTTNVLLSSSQRTAMNTLVTEAFLLSNNIAQLTAKALRTEVDAYNWNAFPTVWEGLYESLTDIKAVEERAIVAGNEQLEGVALVWQAVIFSTLTNAYGDIPFSEAIGGANNNFTPAYDTQESIYNTLLSNLERANTLLAGSGSISGDLIFGGDASKWQKLANSLRLRLLMTANQQIANAGTQFSAIVSSANIMTSNTDNATLTYLDVFPNQYPLIPLKSGDFAAVEFGKAAFDVMNTYRDPRLMRYARPDDDDFTATNFSGRINNLTGDNAVSGSALGVQYWNDPNKTQRNILGLIQAEGIIMTYAEVEFLLAEAVQKGWITGTIETHYRNGIEASMDYYQVDYTPFIWADFNDFYTNSGIAYSTPTDIWEQKWLALFFHGLEPYFELRRWYHESGMSFDGIPFLSAPVNNVNGNQLPMRFLYPGQEQSLNSSNYQTAVDRLGGNNQNARMWLVQ